MIVYNVYVYNKSMMAQGIGGKASGGKSALCLKTPEQVASFIKENVNPDYEGFCVEMESV